MPVITPRFLFLASMPLQIGALAGHLILTFAYPKQIFLREALPLIYLGATYLQWLAVAVFISLRTKVCRVPFLMHVPHLLSFLPLLRHVMLAAERTPADTGSLTLAWVHAVVTHSFSLVAAWLWQVRRQYDAHGADLLRKEIIPLSLYVLAALTTILLYAGLDFSFAANSSPLAVGIIQLLLNTAVTVVLLYREHGALKPLAVIAALFFSLVNGLLLFDRVSGGFNRDMPLGVEVALAATSFTQIFSLFVFLIFSRRDAV
ncbi:MAG: hypothetical protein KF713_11730 [Turneriella sp.]|nr:hypothetical protein [Turneriella sp.]